MRVCCGTDCPELQKYHKAAIHVHMAHALIRGGQLLWQVRRRSSCCDSSPFESNKPAGSSSGIRTVEQSPKHVQCEPLSQICWLKVPFRGWTQRAGGFTLTYVSQHFLLYLFFCSVLINSLLILPLFVATYEPCQTDGHTIKPLLTLTSQLVTPSMFQSFLQPHTVMLITENVTRHKFEPFWTAGVCGYICA